MPAKIMSPDADILILGEAPGRQEDADGEPWVGPSGKLLRKVVGKRNLERCILQNVVRCHPEDDVTPSVKAVHACSVHLDADVADLPIKAILGAGTSPLQKFYPGGRITDMHGTRFPVMLNGRPVWYYPILHPSYVLRLDRESRSGSSAAGPVLSSDVRNFFRDVDRWPAPKIMDISLRDVTIARTEAQAQALIDRMSDPIAVDIETVGLRPYQYGAEILSAAFSDGVTTIAFSVSHPDAPNDWGMRLMLDTVRRRRWIAHNAGMELPWFRYFAGTGEPFTNFEDTMALGRLYHQRETLLALEKMSVIHCGVNVKSFSQINVTKLKESPVAEVLRYNGLDALTTRPIYDMLRDKVDDAGYQRLLQAVDTTCGMEMMGLPFSQAVAGELKAEWEEVRSQAETKARNTFEAKEFTRARNVDFNPGSPKHIGEALSVYGRARLPQTPSGGLATDEAALTPLVASHPLAKHILDYRAAAKNVSTYLNPVLEVPRLYPDGLLHPSFTVMLTATLRLSSNGPNIQNFPHHKHGNLRRMFVAPAGHLIVAFDFGQLEARVVACASGDEALIASFLNEEDIHADWRDRLLALYPAWRDACIREMKANGDDLSEKTIMKTLRYKSKNGFVFASLYGSTAQACARNLGVPPDVGERLQAAFWEKFPGVASWIHQQFADYEIDANATTLTGRVRHAYLSGNEPINTPVQGSAADIVTAAMNELTILSRVRGEPYLHARVQIHDELIFILPDDDRVLDYVDTIQRIMTKARFPWQVVPMIVEAKCGEDWSTLEEFAVFKGDRFTEQTA